MKQALTNSILLTGLIFRHLANPETVLLDSGKTSVRLNHLYIVRPFPIRVIVLIRDGRGTVNSWLKDSTASFADTVRSWQHHMEHQLRMLEVIREEDKIIVRYEDLCMDIEGELQRICDFIQIPYEKKMLDMEGPFHMLGGNPGTVTGTRIVAPDKGWELNFDEAKLKLFDELAGSLNRRLEYE